MKYITFNICKRIVFFLYFRMASAHLMLLESNDDLLGPSCDLDTIKTFLVGLEASGNIQNLSSKELRALTSRSNILLQSSNKLKGLLIIKTIVDQCNSEVFERHAQSWAQTCASRVIDSKEATTEEKVLACQILRKIYRISPNNVDVTKQIAPITGGIVNSILKNFELDDSFIITLAQILQSFPGSSGSSEKIRKKIFESFGRHSSIKLSKCASFLPRLGGSGKEGAHHKEAWSLYFKRFLKTYWEIQHQLIDNANCESIDLEKDFLSEIEPIKEMLTKPSHLKDLLAISFHWVKQLSFLKDLISEFLKAPFPYAKIFQPSLIYQMSDKLFNVLHILNDNQNISEEFNVFKCVYPNLISINMSILNTLLRVCQKDLIPYIPKIVCYINQTLDLAAGESLQFELKSSSFQLYKTIIKVLGASSGAHTHAEEIISKLLREIVPAKSSSENDNVSPSTPKNKKSKNKSTMWKMASNSKSQEVEKCIDLKSKLIAEALVILSEMFLASGCLIAPSLHKDVQIVVLKLCMDIVHQQNLHKSVYASVSVRMSVYSLLTSLALNPHFKFHSPLRYVITILSKGLHDRDPSVAETARSGLSAIEACFHSRSPYFGSESYFDKAEIEKVMTEIVKVHETKIFVKRGNAGSYQEKYDNSEIDDVVQNVISSTSDAQTEGIPNGFEDKDTEDNSLESSVKIKESVAKQEENERLLKKVAQMEEILKESKKKNSDEELLKAFYNQEQDSVCIPDDTKEHFYEKDRSMNVDSPSDSKKIKLAEESVETEDDGLDLNDMLSSFVDNANLSSLKRKFKDDYVA
uniref:Proline, glutamic acid and leucinerich protein 1-like [Saccoglossus kowalevskii] n=1 Tax=Lepeophtheirus salmonis TaxID=72036 RepID=A0A0K2SW93_LEPSM